MDQIKRKVGSLEVLKKDTAERKLSVQVVLEEKYPRISPARRFARLCCRGGLRHDNYLTKDIEAEVYKRVDPT